MSYFGCVKGTGSQHKKSIAKVQPSRRDTVLRKLSHSFCALSIASFLAWLLVGHFYSRNDDDTLHENRIPCMAPVEHNFSVSAPITEALELLKTVRPDQVEYLRSRGSKIRILPHKEFVAEAPAHPFARGVTNPGTCEILVQQSYARDIRSRAAIISHEATHVAFHDPARPEFRLLRNPGYFGWSQEDECHFVGLNTLKRLGGHFSWDDHYDILRRYHKTLLLLSIMVGICLYLGISRIIPMPATKLKCNKEEISNSAET